VSGVGQKTLIEKFFENFHIVGISLNHLSQYLLSRPFNPIGNLTPET